MIIELIQSDLNKKIAIMKTVFLLIIDEYKTLQGFN